MKKPHFKFYFLLSVSLAIVFGAVLYFSVFRGKPVGDDSYIGPRVAPIVVGNQSIEFPYTDENKDETLIIKTDQKTYNNFNSSDVYTSITNTSKNSEKTVLLFYFPDDSTLKELRSLSPSLTALEKRVGDKWEFITFFKKNIKLNDNLLGLALAKRQSIPDNLKVKAGAQIEIAAGETMYFRSKIAFAPGSSGEFWIEAVGSNGGYGLLDPWYNSGWSYRKKITIDRFKVSGGSDLTNFPVLISQTDPDMRTTANGGKAASGSGEFVITSSDGTTVLPHEIESYSATTGQFIGWVNVTTLSVSQDTTLYMYYGGPSSGATNQNKTGVWDGNYKLVLHLKEDPSSTCSGTKEVCDSTSNARHGDANGTMTSGDKVTGKIGNAIDFDGSDDGIDFGDYDGIEGTAALTYSWWAKVPSDWRTDGLEWNVLWDKFGTEHVFGFSATAQGATTMNFLVRNSSNVDVTASIGELGPYTGKWVYFTGVYNGANLIGYINGVQVVSEAQTGTTDSNANSLGLGGRVGDATDQNHAKAIVDEARVSVSARSADWIKTEYNNQSSPGTFAGFGGQEVALRTVAGVKFGTSVSADTASGWYSASGNSWSYRKKITIDKNKVSGTSNFSNFPVLISMTDSTLATTANGGKAASGSGEFVFTSSNGTTVLPYEIETYSATTGQFIGWVSVATLSVSADTHIYMYYGGPSSGATNQNKTGVWDANYKGVWHLPNGTSLTTSDSTSNAYNLTNNGTVTATVGKVDGAAGKFNGTTQNLSNASLSVTAGSQITVSFWNHQATADVQEAAAFDIGHDIATERILAHAPWSDKVLYWDYGNSVNPGGRVSIDYTRYLDKWTYVTLAFDGSNNHIIYLDGVLVATSNNANTPSTTKTDITIGRGTVSGAGTWYHKASLDEFRVSTTARSADWIKTEYNNQSSPSVFYSLGGLEAQTLASPGLKIKGGVKFK